MYLGVRRFAKQVRQAVAAEPGRRRVLRAQDRHHHPGRAAPLAPVRHHPARLPAAGAVQPQLRQVQNPAIHLLRYRTQL